MRFQRVTNKRMTQSSLKLKTCLVGGLGRRFDRKRWANIFLTALAIASGTMMIPRLAYGQTTTGADGYIPNMIAPGTPASSYPLTNLFSLNYYTGSLNITLPVMTLNGRGEIVPTLSVIIDFARQIQDRPGSSPVCPGPGYCDLYSPAPTGILLPGSFFGNTIRNPGGTMVLNQASNIVQNVNGLYYTDSRLYFYRPDGGVTELVDVNYYGQPVATTCGSPGSASACQNLANRGSYFISDDGSQLNFQSDTPIVDSGTTQQLGITGTLYFPNGTKIRFSGAGTTITDRNGNITQIGTNSVTDSTGHVAQVTTTSTDEAHSIDTISYPGFQGANRTATVSEVPLAEALAPGYALETGQQVYPSLNGVPASDPWNPTVIATVTLANGDAYHFLYNSYGELARCQLPTGGAYEFTWSPIGPYPGGIDLAHLAILRGVTEMRDYPDGQTLARRTDISYSIPAGQDGTVTTNSATVTEYDGNSNPLRITDHYFYQVRPSKQDPLSHNAWKDGLEYETDIYDGSGKLWKKTVNTWQQKGALPWSDQGNPYLGTADTQQAYDPRNVQIDTTLDNGLVSRVALGYDQFNNITDRKEYDFGSGAPGGLLRDTVTYYVTDATHDDIPVRLLRLPSQVNVYDGSGNLAALTYYDYDEGSISDAPGVIGHDPNVGTGDNLRGNLTSKSSWINNTNSYATEAYSYDIAGNLIGYTDARANADSTLPKPTVSYNYSDAQNTYAHPTTTTNAAGQSTQANYDYSIGKIISFTDLNGVGTGYVYNDSLDRLTQIRHAPGGGPTQDSHTNYFYNSPTNITEYDSQTSGYDIPTVRIFDGFGRLFETANYEDPTDYIATTQTYDALGRVASTTNPSRQGDGLDFATTYGYDPLGRPTSVQTADGSTTTTSYLGNQVTTTDPAGKQRKLTYDALGRLTSVAEDPSGANYATTYTYDPLDDLTSVIQGSQTRSFTYDSLKRLTKAVNPESGTVSYIYDNDGNLTQRTDNRNVVTTYLYDALNRLQQKSYSDGTPTVQFGYDSPAAPYSKGHLTTINNGYASENMLGFDALGRVLLSNQQMSGQTYTFSYTWNLAGALTSETFPSGRTVSISYDGANRVSGITGTVGSTQKTYLSDVNYAPQGSPNWYLYGNNLCRAFTYNSRLQTTSMIDSAVNGAAPNGSSCTNGPNEHLVQSFTWGTTNNNGNLQSVTTSHGGPNYPQFLTFNTSFTYDGVNRLKTASDSGGWSRTFGYDQFGNMWTSANSGLPTSSLMPTSNVFTGGANRISGATYDAAGNQTVAGADSYTYDAENRLVMVTETPAAGGGQEQLIYDGQGQRIAKWVTNGPAREFIYDALGHLAAEYSSASPSTTLPCATCYLSTDHLGSTRLVTDESASIIARHDYVPFGEEIPGNTAGRLSEWGPFGDNVTQKFTGKIRDSETGLDYFGARYYGAMLGRWTSPDRINLTSARLLNPTNTLNKYIYGGNNPLKYVDADGEDITIFYRPPSGAPLDFGHIFVGALNQATGQVGFLDYYPARGTDSVGSGPGVFNTGDFQSRAQEVAAGKFATLTIQTTPDEAQKVIDQISHMLNGFAPGYSVAFNNCTSTCEDVLRDLGLDFGDKAPSTYWGDVYRRYSQDVQNNPFKAFPFTAPPQQPGVEYGNPGNYGVNYNWLLFLIYQNQWNQQQKNSPPPKACVSASDDMGNSTGTTCDAN